MVNCEFFELPIEHGEKQSVIDYWKIYAYCKKEKCYVQELRCKRCKIETKKTKKGKALW